MAEKQSKEMQAEVKENVAAETNELLVKVTRECFGEKDGVKLYSYHIHALIRGQKKDISLVPKDNGAYDLLNIIYGDLDTVDGAIVFSEFKTEDGGVIKSILVEVFVIDDGIKYSYQLKTQRDSDKASLQILVQILKLKQGNK